MPLPCLPIPDNKRTERIQLPDVPPPKRPARLFSRLFTVVLSAVTVSSFGLRAADMLGKQLIPDGYTYTVTADDAPFSALSGIGRLLPISRPALDTADAEAARQPQTTEEAEIPSNALRIVEHDFSGSGLSNETPYRPDLEKLLNSPLPFDGITRTSSAEGPTVLILHTHGSEAYTEDGALSYPKDSGMRSYDINQNVVAVGTAVTERLESHGIGVLHLTEMFDAESYYNSYNRSLEAVKSCLDEYPSIRFIIDLHRDASADTSRGIAYKPVTEIGGEKYAQLMLVVGTDHLGADHPDWEKNLSLALKLQKLLSDISPSLVRPINLRGASFNQQYGTGFLLLEAGSCSNTLDEAKRSGVLFADCLAELIGNIE